MGCSFSGGTTGLKFGSTTFSVYVSDLPTVVRHSQMSMYANDTELHLCGHDLLSVQHAFQCDLDAVQAWLCINRLQLNVSKSTVMLIGTRQRITYHNVTVHIGGQVLTEVPYIKYLSVFINQHLTWQKNNEYVL